MVEGVSKFDLHLTRSGAREPVRESHMYVERRWHERSLCPFESGHGFGPKGA